MKVGRWLVTLSHRATPNLSSSHLHEIQVKHLLRSCLTAACYCLSAACYYLTAAFYCLSAACYCLGAACYYLTAACYCLTAACYCLTAACYCLTTTCCCLTTTRYCLTAACYCLPTTCYCLTTACCCLVAPALHAGSPGSGRGRGCGPAGAAGLPATPGTGSPGRNRGRHTGSQRVAVCGVLLGAVALPGSSEHSALRSQRAACCLLPLPHYTS